MISTVIKDKWLCLYYPLVACASGGLSLAWAFGFGNIYKAGKNALSDYLMWSASLLVPALFIAGVVFLVFWIIYKCTGKKIKFPGSTLFSAFVGGTVFSIGYCLSRVERAVDSGFIQGYLAIFGIISAIQVVYSINNALYPSKKNDNQ